MIAFVVHLIRRSPHDYWDVISMTPATSHVVYNSIDLDHMTMRCKYLQCTPINTFLYYLVPFLVKKMIINWKISTYLVRVSFFSVQTLVYTVAGFIFIWLRVLDNVTGNILTSPLICIYLISIIYHLQTGKSSTLIGFRK